MSQHAAPDTKAPIEKKTWVGALGTFGASLVVALTLALMAEPTGLGQMPQWSVFLLVALGPVVVQFASAYAAPHTPRTDPAALRAARE